MQISKRALQTAIVIAGMVPVAAGLSGIILGPQLALAGHAAAGQGGAVPMDLSLDSHFRYLSGLLLGLGLTGWSCVPNIERHGVPLRILAFIVLIGGLGRLWALLTVGVPDTPMVWALVMELIITPSLALWQYRLAKQTGAL